MKTKFARNTKSTREERRAIQREAERQQKKQELDAFMRLPVEERRRIFEHNAAIDRIQRNGITIEDLDRAGQEGYQDGAKQAAESTMKNIYAAVALVLHEKYGYGKKRCMDVLNAVDQKVMYALDTQEMIQQVWDDLNIAMTFDGDPLEDRITEKGA